jgi:DNA transformation protein and related proteins
LPTRKTPGGAPTRRPDAPGFRGLGPRSRQWLAGIGISTPEQLAAQDPFEVYRRIKATQSGVSLNLLYGLIGAVEHRDWRDIAREDRTSILLRLDDMGLL